MSFVINMVFLYWKSYAKRLNDEWKTDTSGQMESLISFNVEGEKEKHKWLRVDPQPEVFRN